MEHSKSSYSLDVVIPVLNEEEKLVPKVQELHQFLSLHMSDFQWRIVIADNGSTDSTLLLAQDLAKEFHQVGYLHLTQRGRGRALRKAWSESDADIVSYMDVDLSTRLNYFPPLVKAVAYEGSSIAIGSRLKAGAKVTGRSPKREFISRVYSCIFRTMFLTGFRDAQCGFKALNRQAVKDIVPLVQDNGWLFDTELLLLAENNGYRIAEVPVEWVDDPDSRVRIARTAYDDLKGLLRLRFGGLRRASRVLKSSPKIIYRSE